MSLSVELFSFAFEDFSVQLSAKAVSGGSLGIVVLPGAGPVQRPGGVQVQGSSVTLIEVAPEATRSMLFWKSARVCVG